MFIGLSNYLALKVHQKLNDAASPDANKCFSLRVEIWIDKKLFPCNWVTTDFVVSNIGNAPRLTRHDF